MQCARHIKVYEFRFDGVNRILVQGTWSRGDPGSASAMKAFVVLRGNQCAQLWITEHVRELL